MGFSRSFKFEYYWGFGGYLFEWVKVLIFCHDWLHVVHWDGMKKCRLTRGFCQ